MQLVNIGFGNTIRGDRIIAIVNPGTAPIKRLIQDARESQNLVDATCGRKTRSVVFMDSGHIVLASVQPDTISSRLSKDTIEE